MMAVCSGTLNLVILGTDHGSSLSMQLNAIFTTFGGSSL